MVGSPTGPTIRRIETSRAGELVHVDVKKLARVPQGGGHKLRGRAVTKNRPGLGYTHIRRSPPAPDPAHIRGPGGRGRPRFPVHRGRGERRSEDRLHNPAAPRGGTVQVHVGLNAATPDQSATLTLRRDKVVEGSAVVPLDRYDEGLGLVASTWAPFDLSGCELPIGRLTIGAEQLGARPLPGVSLEVTLEGDAGFVSAVPGIDLLPEGCSTPGWPPPGGSGEVQLPPDPSRPPALLGGLPTTVVCDLGELAPGNAAPLCDLVVLVRPWYRDGDGIDEAPSATVTLRLQDPAGDSQRPRPRSTSSPRGRSASTCRRASPARQRSSSRKFSQ